MPALAKSKPSSARLHRFRKTVKKKPNIKKKITKREKLQVPIEKKKLSTPIVEIKEEHMSNNLSETPLVETQTSTESQPPAVSMQQTPPDSPSAHTPILPVISPQPIIEDIPLERQNHFLYISGIVATGSIISLAILFPFVAPYIFTDHTSPSPTIIMPTTPPLPSVTPIPKKSDILIDVLNGSGRAGAAKNVADQLQQAGYSIGTIGNATASNPGISIIQVTSDQDTVAHMIKKDLDAISLDSTIAAILSVGKNPTIIVGKK